MVGGLDEPVETLHSDLPMFPTTLHLRGSPSQKWCLDIYWLHLLTTFNFQHSPQQDAVLHNPQGSWSYLGVQPAILLNYFWDEKNKDEFHTESVHSLWIYTVESIFSCTVLLANPVEGLCLIVVATAVKIPFWVWSKGAPSVTIWNHNVKWCRSWDIWVYILSRSAGVCKHTSSQL